MRKRRGWLLASLAVLLAASGGGYVVMAGPHGDSGRPGDGRADGLPPATAPVERGDLSSGLQVEGTLGYAKERKLNAAGPGVLTWTAQEGSVVERDGRLYEVAGRAVRLMYGSTPMYRPLKAGDKGEDVKQLKLNLMALGYGTGLDASDGTFTAGTTAAVERWQKAHKEKETGEVAREAVAFASGPQRVQKNDAAVGDEAAPGKPVLTLTGTRRSVRFALDVAKAGSAKTGDKVTVELPGGGTAGGTIESVGSTANPDDPPGGAGGGAGGGSGGGDKPKVEVAVALDDAAEAKGPDRSPVTVRLTGETRTGVLSVPVASLLALTGGGFGVQVVEGGAVRDVRVELGMFGQGRVEVKGDSLKAGMHVGVPAT
ncbi:efflux RND transporter periplasmic adaptor subunit [Streptomyces sp. NPDC048272]|uniref:efflux RND transporter periplasmic adaptor subunit n=1 Tax=Streptomyces sp. NPDC048272 TaxID=3154616 RepID=UPI00342AB9EB